MPGAAGSSDAHPHRAVPCVDSNRVLPTGRTSRVVGKALHLDPVGPGSLGGSAKCFFHRFGLGLQSGIDRDGSNSWISVCFHLGPAKINRQPIHRSKATVESDDDALDDADNDCLLFGTVPHRAVHVLDSLKRHRCSHTIPGNP